MHSSDIYALYLALAFNPSDLFFYVKENSIERYPDNEHAIPIRQVDDVLRKIEHYKKAIGDGVKQSIGVKI